MTRLMPPKNINQSLKDLSKKKADRQNLTPTKVLKVPSIREKKYAVSFFFFILTNFRLLMNLIVKLWRKNLGQFLIKVVEIF
jgi:hypothetical protein